MVDSEARSRRQLAAILMADVSGFSRMMGRDEERTTELIRDFHQRVRELVEEHEGRVVDTAGDSVFGEFPSVVNAMRCAAAIQEDQREINSEAPREEHIQTRIGVHVGDVIIEDRKVYGDGVNIAARLEQLAEPGGICLSEAVYQQVHNKLDMPIEEIGVRELKNIDQPMRLYRVPPSALQVVGESDSDIDTWDDDDLPGSERPFIDDLLHRNVWPLLAIGSFLLLSSPLISRGGGAYPLFGALLGGLGGGRLWSRRTGREGGSMLGVGIAFLAGGAYTASQGDPGAWMWLLGLLCGGRGLYDSRKPASRRGSA